MQTISSYQLMAHCLTGMTIGMAIGSILSSGEGPTVFSANDLAAIVSTCAAAVLCTKFTQEAFKENAKTSANVSFCDYQDKRVHTSLASRVEAHINSGILNNASEYKAVLRTGTPTLTEASSRKELQGPRSAIEANPILRTDLEFTLKTLCRIRIGKRQ